MRSARVVWAAIWLFIMAVCPAFADKRVALIVGNADYQGAPLANPAADADIVAASLEKLDFQVTIVKNADLGAFDRAVTAFAAQADGADIALFYFAGHGFAVSEGLKPVSVLMSTSADVTAASDRVLRSGGIALDEILGDLAGKAKVTLAFVDACRNDPRVGRARGGAGRGFAVLAPVKTARLFVGLSTRLGDTAQDGTPGQGSPFARAFAANIGKKGLRIDDAFRRVRDAVSIETGGQQAPDIVEDDLPEGSVTLTAAAAVAKPSRPRLESRYFVDPLVSDGYLNLRDGPGAGHEIIAPIPAGATDLVVSRCVAPDDGRGVKPFCQVGWRGQVGWVSSCCIAPVGATHVVDPAAPDGFLPLRDGPGATHAVVAKIPAGAAGVAISHCVAPDDGESGKPFCEANWEGTKGWISSCCLRLSQTPEIGAAR